MFSEKFRDAFLPGFFWPAAMIKVEGIHKSFGDVRALRGISFDAPIAPFTLAVPGLLN